MGSIGRAGLPPTLLLLLLLLLRALVGASAVAQRRQRPGYRGADDDRAACDIFTGSWVKDESSSSSYPSYQGPSCPVIDPQFNCQLYGRPDSDYLRYRWRPAGCQLPRFDGIDFLTRLRGKTVMFVGDSLGRNQWQSLICMLNAAVPSSRAQFIKDDPLYTYKFLDYGASISFYRAPYLVDMDVVQGRRVLMLDDISGNANAWRGADVLLFNSGHWWTHKGAAFQGWDYMGEGGSFYEDMDRLVAFQKGMTTWANWVDVSVDRAKTKVFFQSISPTHYNPAEWGGGGGPAASGNCYGEIGPVSGANYSGRYPEQMPVLKGVIRAMRSPAFLLDITALSELRKDCHPSIYNGGPSPDVKSADCSHWCLPGLPDTWNHLFYAALFFLS